MYILDTDPNKIYQKKAIKTALAYLLTSAFWAFFGAVYELFSHEVYSYFMIYAFAIPLLGGAVPFTVIALLDAEDYPGIFGRVIYHSGLATLTVGSIIRGVLDIYGTANRLLGIYWTVGVLLALGGAVLIVTSMLRNKV